jgi:CheY-like chemotaxis protein
VGIGATEGLKVQSMTSSEDLAARAPLQPWGGYAVELIGLVLIYLVLAKIGLMLRRFIRMGRRSAANEARAGGDAAARLSAARGPGSAYRRSTVFPSVGRNGQCHQRGRARHHTDHLYLPRSEVLAAAADDPGRHGSLVRADGTILVVEDNLDVADVTAMLLQQIRYRVLRAGNADDALNTLRVGDRIDLMFSDIVLTNGMNGIHLAQEVREHFPAIRVLLTTGYSEVAAAGETRFPVLRKPFELQELEQAIREVMTDNARGRRRAWRGLAN